MNDLTVFNWKLKEGCLYNYENVFKSNKKATQSSGLLGKITLQEMLI